MNPVAAGMVARPEEYQWSSASAHLAGQDDQLVTVKPMLDLISDWRSFLTLADDDELDMMKKHKRSGRPLGEASFVERLEADMARLLRPAKRGPKTRTT
jgi:putative transposase